MNNHTTTIHIDNLVSESKHFLQKIRSIQNNTKPTGIKIQIMNNDTQDNHTLIYEQHVYVVVVPKGKKENALLYGNWEEAIRASHRMLIEEHHGQKHHITLTPYSQVI